MCIHIFLSIYNKSIIFHKRHHTYSTQFGNSENDSPSTPVFLAGVHASRIFFFPPFSFFYFPSLSHRTAGRRTRMHMREKGGECTERACGWVKERQENRAAEGSSGGGRLMGGRKENEQIGDLLKDTGSLIRFFFFFLV